MTEDIVHFVNHAHCDPWRISGHDADTVRELHQAVRAWLPAFQTGAEVVDAGQTLHDLEMLAQNGSAPGHCEIEVSRLDEAGCGVSVVLAISVCSISMSVIEFLRGPNGIPDHGTVLDGSGHPISLTLDDMGSFDRDRFQSWWFRAMDLAPGDPIQPRVTATIKRENQ